MADDSKTTRAIEVAKTFLLLGLTSFGGPVAHLAYFRSEFVDKRRWLSDLTFAENVALCQLLPGPASSQVAFLIGKHRAGFPGAILAAVCFALPSVCLMLGIALGVMSIQTEWATPVLHGLKLAAVAVVAQAVWSMGQSLCPDRERVSLCLLSAAALLLLSHQLMPIAAIVAGAIAGLFLLRKLGIPTTTFVDRTHPRARVVGWILLAVFFALLMLLPPVAKYAQPLATVDSLYRAGALVIGGGHVVLPLLQNESALTSTIDTKTFLAGYGATQAMPGPLFSFGAYLGAMSTKGIWAIPMGIAGSIAIFLPGFLLVAGVEPFWNRIKFNPRMKHMIAGANAAVVGVLLAALYHPLMTTALTSPRDLAVVILGFLALVVWRLPVWGVVIAMAGMGLLLGKMN
jgi:chromate transporter